jgi:DNA-binding LytR/AlgR family response regulator
MVRKERAVPARCLIVDDESPARDELRHLLGDFDDVVVVGEATTAEEAELLIGSLRHDVVFLDVRMPGMGGLELARLLRVRPERPAVIFTTAYADHAVEAFDLEAADYLVKPFDAVRLRRALDRALEHRAILDATSFDGHEATDPSVSQVSNGPSDVFGDVEADDHAATGQPDARAAGGRPEPPTADHRGLDDQPVGGRPTTPPGTVDPRTSARIPVHRGDRIILVEESRIAFAEAARGYAYLKLVLPAATPPDALDDRLLTSYTLNDLEDRFSPDFVRTHRSFLVNLRHVREVVPHVGGTLTLVMGDRARSQVPVARRQAAEVRRRLGV